MKILNFFLSGYKVADNIPRVCVGRIKKTEIMNEAEKLLEKFARKNMIQWNQESFKRTHSQLHKSIIEALNEALRIHDVKQLKAFVDEFIEAWEDGNGGDSYLYRKAKSL